MAELSPSPQAVLGTTAFSSTGEIRGIRLVRIPGAVVVRGPQADGTFEGLSEGTDYYIAVISGSTCSDVEGPLTIVRPDPITYRISTTQIIMCRGG